MSEIDSLLQKLEEALTPDFLVAELQIDGLDTGPVLRVEGEEALSRQFKYEVEVELDGPPPDLSFVIGAAASLTVRDAAGNAHAVVGIVADILVRSFDANTHRADVVIKPRVYRQSLGRDCYAMQNVGSIDVIKDVLADYTGKVRYELSRSYPTYPYAAWPRSGCRTQPRVCDDQHEVRWALVRPRPTCAEARGLRGRRRSRGL